jgi:hypothetical protein
MRAPLAPPRLSVPRKVDGRRPGRRDELRASGRTRGSLLERLDVARIDQLVIDGRHRVLPDLRLGHLGAEQRECGPMSRCVSLYQALAKAVSNSSGSRGSARDLAVGRVRLQRDVGREHHRRVFFAGSCASGHGPRPHRPSTASTARRRPGSSPAPTRSRRGSRSTRCRPLRRGDRPGALEAAGDRVAGLAAAVAVLPAEALLSSGAASGSGPTLDASPAPWHLPNVCPPAISATVSSSFIAMRRRSRGCRFARRERVGIAVRALGVHVDQAHLHRGERVPIRDRPSSACHPATASGPQ